MSITRCRIPVAIILLGWLLVAAGTAAADDAACRRQLALKDNWLVKQLDTDKPDIAALAREAASPDKTWLAAPMPAEVHEILLQRGLIPDPHVGKNAAACSWVSEKNWAYVCRFETPRAAAGPALLRFEGLDTLADAWLNGAPIGHFANMYREFSVDVKDRLAPPGQQNTLVIVFFSPIRFRDECKRKCHGDFSSYLGAAPHFAKVGVYRDVVLDLREQAWIEDVCVRTPLSPDCRAAKAVVHVETGGANAELWWTLVEPSGRRTESHASLSPQREARDAASPFTHTADLEIPVLEPKLWWPRMSGEQPLYALDISLSDGNRVLDRRRITFGIRDVKPVLSDPVTGERRFRFDINGRPVFLRGGDWAPLEGLTHVWNADRAKRLLDLAERGNMNVIRVWGEGELPPPSFYEECDRRGILIWQDFMFGFYSHSKGDTAFLDNCRAEVEQTIRRLRNHPSLLLWVGGNEQYLWSSTTDVPDAKREIFERMLPEACARLDPGRLFHPSSPYGGVPTGNYPLEGDWHDYTTINYEPLASAPLYASEVLRASTPSLAGMRRFMSEAELWPEGFDPAVRKPGQPAWPPAWAYHSTGVATWDRVGAIEQFCDPATAGQLIRVIGSAHGEYLRERVERERRGVPDGMPDGNRRCWGNMVWRLNDTWPMIYSSVIDYYLEPKIAYYYLRRAYEPVLVSLERTADRICAWVINDSMQPVAGTLVVQRRGFDGKSRGKLQAEIALKPGEAKRCLDLTPLGDISLRSEFLHATVAGHEATCLLIGERYLHLPQAHLTVRKEGDRVEVATDVFAKQVVLELEGSSGAVFEDNYFDLPPGQKRTISLVNAASGGQVTVRAVNAEAATVAWKP